MRRGIHRSGLSGSDGTARRQPKFSVFPPDELMRIEKIASSSIVLILFESRDDNIFSPDISYAKTMTMPMPMACAFLHLFEWLCTVQYYTVDACSAPAPRRRAVISLAVDIFLKTVK